MATKEATDYLGDSWSKYYCKVGKEVIHVNDLYKDKAQRSIMVVDKVLRSEVKVKSDPDNPEKPSRIVGIKVHWYNNGQYNVGVFHTKELIPKDVVDQGIKTYEDWLQR